MSTGRLASRSIGLILYAVKKLPEWLPGTSFKQTARHIKNTAYEAAGKPWKFVESQMAQGRHAPSFVSNLIDQGGEQMSEEDIFTAKWTSLSIYLGGADTVSFIYVIAFHSILAKHMVTIVCCCNCDVFPCHDLASRDSTKGSRRDRSSSW